MINLYFVDDYQSSEYNGIGTFRDIFIQSFGESNVNFNLVSFNAVCESFSKIRHGNWREYKFGKENNDWRMNIYDKLLFLKQYQYLIDCPQNVFLFNYRISGEIIYTLKRIFPLSKFIFVIHDQEWTSLLLGCRERLQFILKENNMNTQKSSSIVNFVIKEEIEKERALYNSMDKVVCLSKSTYDILVNIYMISPLKIELIHNGVKSQCRYYDNKTLSQYRHQLGIENNEKVIIYVGRPAQIKGYFVLLEVLKRLIGSTLAFKVILAGPINENLKELLNNPDFRRRLAWYGFTDRRQLDKLYAISDIAVLPSYSEQCSFVALEAISHNLLVIASDGQGLKEMFMDNNIGIISNIGKYNNPEYFINNLTNTLIKAINIKKKSADIMIKNQSKILKEIYSEHLMIDKYNNLFTRVSSY